MGRRVKVADLIVRTREVEIGEKCENCGADLNRDSSLMAWTFADEAHISRLATDKEIEDGIADGGVLESPDCDIDAGSTFIYWVELRCIECDNVIVAGTSDISDNTQVSNAVQG